MHFSDTNGDTPARDSFTIEDWTVAPSRNLLARGDEQVRVEPRVMDVLVHLADHADQVVSKEDLIERVWKSRFVTDDVLTAAIYGLRRALGDDARRPRYIETVSRRGYRLIAPVKGAQPEVGRQEASTRAPDNASHAEAGVSARGGWAARAHSWTMTVAGMAAALFAAGAVWMLVKGGPFDSWRFARGKHVPTAEAHEAYLKGRYFLDQRSIRGWRQALEQFERAVALDPQDPAAQAGLADTYSAMSDFGVATPAEMRPRAMKTAQRALELDSRSAEGHEALGRIQFLFDWDFTAAERSLAHAVALDPDYMPAYQAMAWLESARGHHAESVAAAQRALQLDPVNIARYTELAWVLALSGRQAEALREVDRALQLNPRSFETYVMKGWTFEISGQPDAAFAAYRTALQITGSGEESLQRIETVYRAEGLAGYYRGWLKATPAGPTVMSDTRRAQLYVRTGELDRAIESLELAYQKREGALAWVNVEPGFDPLRSDARFQRIAARVGQRK